MFILSLWIFLLTVTSEKTHKIYWNTTNDLFYEPKPQAWRVQADDVINFLCPSDHKSSYKILWSYDVEDFKLCRENENVTPLLDCSKSSPEGYELNIFTHFTLPGSPFFELNKPVYFFAQPNLCKKKNMKLEVMRYDPNAEEKGVNDDSNVTVQQPTTREPYDAKTSVEQYRYLIIMAIFAGILLIGIHVILCIAWLPKRLKRKASNGKTPENGTAIQDDVENFGREKLFFNGNNNNNNNNLYQTVNSDFCDNLMNFGCQQIKPSDSYPNSGTLHPNPNFSQVNNSTSTLAFPINPNIYSAPFPNLTTNQEFYLTDQAAFMIQQNELQKQLQLHIAAQLIGQQQLQQQKISQEISTPSIYDVPREGNNYQTDSSYGTLNKKVANKASTRQKNSSHISTNPHHTNRRKKS